jgi:hypothetical protein
VPGGTGAEDWPQDVGCVYCEGPDAVLLIDPLLPASVGEQMRFWEALDRDLERVALPLVVVITLFYHERSAGEIAGRYGARVLVEERHASQLEVPAETFRAGDVLPGGAVSIDAHRRGEVLLWLPDHATLVAGDVLLGTVDGGLTICPDSWGKAEPRGDALRAALRPALLDLPVEIVLNSHWPPILSGGREALARALAPAAA